MSHWIDISRTLTNGIIHWPGDQDFHWERITDMGRESPANVSTISTTVHIGTHIDAPLHFIPGGDDVAQLPLARLCGPTKVVEMLEPRAIEVADLEKARIPKGHRVLFKTANALLWDKPDFDPKYVGLSGEAAMWLVDNETPLVGVDYLSVDPFEAEGSPAHHALLGNNVIIIECLDLEPVDEGVYEMVALPLKIANSEASPARVILRALDD
jgi:arylformamidase